MNALGQAQQAVFREVPGGHMSAVAKPELGQAIAEFLGADRPA